MKKLRLRKALKLRATSPFEKKDAVRGMNVQYYKSYSRNMRDYVFLEKEKRRRSTKRWDYVTGILERYKEKGFSGRSGAGIALNGIFRKNCAYAKKELPFHKTSNVLKVLARPETLWLAYRRLKGNKGILTPGAAVSKEEFNNYTELQKDIFFRKKVTPDGFSMRDVYTVSRLIRRNAFPWGSSRRIWLDKPGSNKKRPITIPPFMDKLVQEAIKMILVSIWEPDFERMNRSFGFRPNKSCHDAIVALQSNHTIGLTKALEGDISAAYDNVRKEDIIRCLEQKIQDRRFIRFMVSRLNYDYVDQSNKTRVRPSIGIPQGGIDSPYLFNIVFHELDKFVMNDMSGYLDRLNSKIGLTRSGRSPTNRARRSISDKMLRTIRKANELRSKNFELNKPTIFSMEKEVKLMKRKVVNLPFYNQNVKKYRLFYVRYADDWILLSNASTPVLEKMRRRIKVFLFDSLGAQLSEEKSLITDLKERAAHFLGFEICARRKPRFLKVEGGIRRFSTFPLVFRPDRTRLINRMHTRGFCDKRGFPISVPWLTGLETTVIIERYNATIRGLMSYYVEWVTRPSDLHRWIYILRYSCFKTLAHKFKSSINKIMIRFGTDRYSKATKTIEAFATIKVGDITYEKGYKLVTFLKAREDCMNRKRWSQLNRVFLQKEAGEIGGYPIKPERPSVTHENFPDMINWVSLRTRAAFDMPCAICGAMDDIQMHHIKHIRKTAYRDLEQANYLRIMALRNRKQIPVCHYCHRHVIHGAKYQGPPLKSLIKMDNKLVDNRVVHLESFVKPGKEYFSRSLQQRGWRESIRDKLNRNESSP